MSICTSGSYLGDNIGNDPNRTQEEKNCAGAGITADQMIAFWNTNDCNRIFGNILNELPNGARGYNPDRLDRVSQDINSAFTTYLSEYSITSPSRPGFNPFQQVLLKQCQDGLNLPGVCDNYLCNEFCPQLTYSDINNNPIYANWCGCYTSPPPNENVIIDDNLVNPVVTNCQRLIPVSGAGNVPCYPLCHRASTVSLYRPEDGCKFQCNNTVCVIDDVVINVDESSIGGGVNITQVCPSCGPGQLCVCIVSGNNLEESFEALGIESTFNQYCGSNSVCYTTDDTGALTPVSCQNFTRDTPSTESPTIPWLFAGIVLVVVIIIIVILFATGGYRKSAASEKATTEDTVESDSVSPEVPENGGGNIKPDSIKDG